MTGLCVLIVFGIAGEAFEVAHRGNGIGKIAFPNLIGLEHVRVFHNPVDDQREGRGTLCPNLAIYLPIRSQRLRLVIDAIYPVVKLWDRWQGKELELKSLFQNKRWRVPGIETRPSYGDVGHIIYKVGAGVAWTPRNINGNPRPLGIDDSLRSHLCSYRGLEASSGLNLESLKGFEGNASGPDGSASQDDAYQCCWPHPLLPILRIAVGFGCLFGGTNLLLSDNRKFRRRWWRRTGNVMFAVGWLLLLVRVGW